MSKRFDPGALLPIEVELVKEKAFALRRVGVDLDKLIAQLHEIAGQLSPPGTRERASQVALHRTLHRQAEQQRWKMIVQREAMGLSRHDDVDLLYPIPPRLRE